MTSEEYEAYVLSRMKPYCDLNYCIIAINGEAGEVAEWYKKFVLRENVAGQHSFTDLQEELGDVLFYITAAARQSGWSISDLMERNRAKLDDRIARNMKQVC